MTVGDWLIVIALGAAIWRLGDLVALGRKLAAEMPVGGSVGIAGDVQGLGKQIDHVGVAVMDLNRDVANLQRELAELNRSIARLTADLGKIKPGVGGATPDLDPETVAAIRDLAALAKDIPDEPPGKPRG